MARLEQERQERLEPQRILYAKQEIMNLGYELTWEDSTKVTFIFKGEKVTFYPYSGWHTGKTIKDGRGIKELLDQIR